VDSFEALAVTILALLPGALFTWSFEREVGNWGAGLADRVYRFVGFSAIFHAVLAYPEYLFWTNYLHVPDADGEGYHNVFTTGGDIAWWVGLVPLVYIGIPIVLGFLASRSARNDGRLGRVLVGRNPAPRAWDELFWRRPALVVRMKLKDGEWVGGLFGDNSYASGYPEPQDLLLEETYEIDDDGTFVQGDEPEDFLPLGSSILISWSEVQFLESFELPMTST
jgi:Family of unknown function (DUF6338)